MNALHNRVADVGSLKGRILVFGGTYGNFQALEELAKVAAELKIPRDHVIHTGDIMGYCAQPNECIELIRDWGIHCIAGNVELQIKNGEDACGCNFEEGSRCDRFAQSWYPYVQQTITPVNKEWLHSLPEFIRFEYAGKQVFVLHGGLQDTSQFVFESTSGEIKMRMFEEITSDVILGGHCGLPFHSYANGKYWLNAGVIGMPANDGTPRVWYMILDDENNQFTYQHHPLSYDFETASKLMEEKSLPLSYAATLKSGIWDNMEILPEEEKTKQGIAIHF